MTFKNTLKSRQAQSTVEYIVVFIVLAMAILVIFGAFNPERLRMKNVFNQAIDGAITRLNQ